MKIERPEAKFGEADERRFVVFKREDGSIARPSDCIVPVVHVYRGRMSLLGTGFFIASGGLLVTARHVLLDVDQDGGVSTVPPSIVQWTEDGKAVLRPLVWVAACGDSDIAIALPPALRRASSGEPLMCKPIGLTTRTPEIGETAFTYAYPNTVSVDTPRPAIHFNPSYYIGRVEEHFPAGRDSTMMPWRCYQTSISLHGGSSGGPVFDRYGNVFGVNCSSIDGAPDVSFVASVVDLLDLPVSIRIEGQRDGMFTVRRLAELDFVRLVS